MSRRLVIYSGIFLSLFFIFISYSSASTIGYNYLDEEIEVVENFLDLDDTPSSYSGSGDFCLKVNSGETSIKYENCSVGGGGGGGDITSVNTDGRFLSGGATSGDVDLLFSETEINKTFTNQNNSINNYILYNNNSVNNYILFNNISLNNFFNTVLNNGSYFNILYNDTWINQTIAVNISEANTSMKNYVDAQNTSQNNYILENNLSVINYILEVNRTTSYNESDPQWTNNFSLVAFLNDNVTFNQVTVDEVIFSGYYRGLASLFPNNPQPFLLPYITNDLGHLDKRGGVVNYSETPSAFCSSDVELFDGSSTNCQWNPAPNNITIIVNFTGVEEFDFGTWFGFSTADFFRATDFSIEAWDNGEWNTVGSETGYAYGSYAKKYNADASGVLALRYNFTAFTTSQFRLSQLFAVNFKSDLGNKMFLSRAGGTVYEDTIFEKDVTSENFTANGFFIGDGSLLTNLAIPSPILWLTFRDDDSNSVSADLTNDLFDFHSGNGITAEIVGDGLNISINPFDKLGNGIEIYDSTGGQTFTTTNTYLDFDTERINTNSNFFNSSGGNVSIVNNGFYEVDYRVSFDVSSGSSRSTASAWLEVNEVEIGGSRVWTYNRIANVGDNTAGASMLLQLSASDVLRVGMVRSSGSDTIITLANSSNLKVTTL